jgi:hypothetical protein
VVIIPAAFMVMLLLLVIDWTPLRRYQLEWLPSIAWFLLWVVWAGLAFTLVALAFIVVVLRVDRLVLESGRIRRHLVFGRRMEVPIEGAMLTRRKSLDVVAVAGRRRRVLVPHVFYAPEDLDRLWEAAGLKPAG